MARNAEQSVTPTTEPPRDLPRGRAKTSAAAVFALVFGLSALVSWLLPPLAILFGIIALILGIVGMSKADGSRVTGKGVAATGLVLGLLGCVLGLAVIAGFANFLTNEQNLQMIENEIQDLRDEVELQSP
ncbi:MAG: UbiA family prenyltransferase [Egibacteraceae bacterium]